MAQDQHQPSASESTQESQLNDSASAEPQDDSDTQDKFQLGFSLGGDLPADTEFPAFSESASAAKGFGITLDTDASPMDDSTSQHGPVTNADLIAESESLAAASMIPEASSTESAHMPEDPESSHMEAEPGQPLRAVGHLPQAESALAAEDSFTVDTRGTGLGLGPPPALGPSAFANSAFDERNGFDDLFKESPYFNPVWESGASPERPSQSQTPFPGTSPSPRAEAGNGGADRSQLQVRVWTCPRHHGSLLLCLAKFGLGTKHIVGWYVSAARLSSSTVYHSLPLFVFALATMRLAFRFCYCKACHPYSVLALETCTGFLFFAPGNHDIAILYLLLTPCHAVCLWS